MFTESKLTPEIVDELLQRENPGTGRPYTQSEIARMFGVSRQYVSKLRKIGGVYRSKREKIMDDHWPWQQVPVEQQLALYHVLRAHLEYIATRGEYMQEWKLQQLGAFYDRLEENGWIVEHRPDIPPNKYAEYGGFRYTKRKPSDGKLIIRQNWITNLSDADRVVWRIPPKRPEF